LELLPLVSPGAFFFCLSAGGAKRLVFITCITISPPLFSKVGNSLLHNTRFDYMSFLAGGGLPESVPGAFVYHTRNRRTRVQDSSPTSRYQLSQAIPRDQASCQSVMFVNIPFYHPVCLPLTLFPAPSSLSCCLPLHLRMFLILLLLLLLTPIIAQAASSKRGLVHVTANGHPSDDSIWITPPTTLTWYYNYGSRPTSSLSSGNLSFVPMLWGDHNNTFVEDVRGQEDVKWVLGFNEPDMGSDVGGSNILPARAAELWKRDIEPLKRNGKELGAPAVSGGPTGTSWLKEFVPLSLLTSSSDDS